MEQQLPENIMRKAVKGISYIAHPLRLRILEYLDVNGIGSEQLKVSQYLKRLKDDGFVISRRQGRFVIYDITQGVHKTCIQCIHKRYDSLEDKGAF